MDRTFRGLISGLIAGIVMNIWNFAEVYLLHISNIRLLDWVAVLTSGTKSQSIFQVITDLIIQIIWDGFLGIIFAHLLEKITSRGIIIKSALFATILWFFFRAVAVLYRITPLYAGQAFAGRFFNLLGAVLWGAILGILLKRFDKTPE